MRKLISSETPDKIVEISEFFLMYHLKKREEVGSYKVHPNLKPWANSLGIKITFEP